MRWALVIGAVLMAGEAEAKPAVQTIRYTTSPCFGACPVYSVTVSSDGHGVFEGVRFTAVQGRRTFRLSPRQWAAFRERLQALHGHGVVDLTGPPLCRTMATDQAGAEVVWSGAWRPHVLRAYYGCDMDRNAWMFTHLRRAPEVLPIAAFIGRPGAPKSPE
jgi:hypothetical protein